MSTTFKEFLSEAEVQPYNKEQPDYDASELVTLIRTHCPIWWDNLLPLFEDPATVSDLQVPAIWRGMSEKKPGVYNPSSGTRSSQNTSNFYTELFSSLPENAKWPRRDKSFICTTDREYAHGYGQIHLVIPFDTTPIGTVLADDMHSLYPMRGIPDASYPDFNRLLDAIFDSVVPLTLDRYNAVVTEWLDKFDVNGGSLVGHAHDVLRRANALWIPTFIKHAFIEACESKETFSKFMSRLLNIYKFDRNPGCFRLAPTAKDFMKRNQWSKEVWFSGECIVLPEEFIKYLL